MYLKKALRGTLTALVFTILAGASWYLFRFLLARNLSLFEYGLFYAIIAFFSFFNLFVDAGFSQAVPKFIIDFKEKNDDAGLKKVLLMSLAFQLFVSVLLFFLIYLLSDFLSAHYFHVQVSEYLLLMGVWFITVPFSYFFGHIFIGFQKYGLSSSIEFARVALTLIFSFLLFRAGAGFYSPVIAYMAINFLLIFLYYPLSLKTVNFSGFKSKVDLPLFSAFLRFGFFVSFSSIMWVIISQVDTLIITFFKGLEAVGLYQAAVPLASIAMYFVTAATVVSYPMSAELYAKKKYDELREGINLFYRYILLVLVPCLMMLFAFSGSVLYVLFGENYYGASFALKILSIGAMFSSITVFNNNILSAVGKPRIVAKNMLYVAILNVVLCFVLIPLFGINGAAFATASSFLVGMIISLVQLNKIVKTNVPVFDWIKTLFSGGLMVSFILVSKSYFNVVSLEGFALLGILGLAIYVAVAFFFKIINVEEIKSFVKNIIK